MLINIDHELLNNVVTTYMAVSENRSTFSTFFR